MYGERSTQAKTDMSTRVLFESVDDAEKLTIGLTILALQTAQSCKLTYKQDHSPNADHNAGKQYLSYYDKRNANGMTLGFSKIVTSSINLQLLHALCCAKVCT